MSRDSQWLTDLNALSRAELDDSSFIAAEKEIYGTSDRVTAIMLSSYIEWHLEKLLKTSLLSEMSELNNPDRNRLWGDRGIFGSFSDKIIACYALKLIGQKSKGDLDIIRLLRNTFAHSKQTFDFENSVIRAACDRLQMADLPDAHLPYGFAEASRIAGFKHIGDRNHPKTRFVISCNILAYRMWVARGHEDQTGEIKGPLLP